ncbi:hypothetical protein CAF53_01650 [Sphingobium sp. LB126]|uniref:TetR/AcrR family transcriptional regulator n=1 Tax=Sphingobium sp. LB126 TaxID=1983755 RepID=UPI000C209956|nr:TetR/AcrR family transcriptional regulator [Sphingobium sp. LB126]PJG47081.1 hypothetical protein CAF53_01650 [Sphingobium sp. LB126]
MTKRRYTLGQRAATQGETRRRIIEATVYLHGTLGPRDTTISGVAERAQVQRLTVYRHFPDEDALFKACTAHWFAANPIPEPSTWAKESGCARVLRALSQLYGYYRRTEQMWTLTFRDESDVPALADPMRRVRNFLDAIRDDLVEHLVPDASTIARVRATLGCAVQFQTWQSLARQGQDDPEIAELVCGWLRGTSASLPLHPRP